MCIGELDSRPRDRRVRNAMLLGSASVLALLVGNSAAHAANIYSRLGAVAPTVAAQQAAAAASQQALAAAAQAQSSLARAAAAIAAQHRLQGAAAALGASSSAANGLGAGGLVPSDPTYSSNWWVGANAPVQTQNGSQVTVDIQQTKPKAILYWDSFNVGANTTVNYEQQSSDWIALNRVSNPTSPSQILGKINAPGQVYIINGNGIVFGAGSQINVNTLIASSLDVGALNGTLSTPTVQGSRDSYFLGLGVGSSSTTPSFSFYDWKNPGSVTSNPAQDNNGNYVGNIVVQPGASITATPGAAQGSTGGDIYLFGTNVSNSGWLSAPTGEIGLVAARTVDFVPNGYSVFPTAVVAPDPKTGAQKFRGTEFVISQFAAKYDGMDSQGNPTGYPSGAPYLSGTGAVVHSGLIEAPRGIVIMDGDRVTIDNPRDASGNVLIDPASGAPVLGVISVDTSISNNSFVMLRGATAVTMNGVISSLPFDDGSSLPTGGSSGSTTASFTPAYIEMTAQSTVTMGAGSLISAPSATVKLQALDFGNDASSLYQPTGSTFNNQLFSLNGVNKDPNTNTSSVPQSVVLSPGSVVDLAGLENVSLPASYNFISFQARAEFANMPLQRSGPLYGQTLWVDIRASGTRSDGMTWSGTPLADANSDVSALGRSIYQLMTTGGSLTLQTDLTTNQGGGQVLTAGSVINVAGGSEQFRPGWVPNTILLGADGRLYNMANADPTRVYVGIANQFTVDHSRWGLSETWSTLAYSPGYRQGQDAGSVSVTTARPDLSGTIYFGSLPGPLQLAKGQLPAQGSLSLTSPSSVEIGSSPSADYTSNGATVTSLSADALSGYGLSSLSITAADVVLSKDSTLNLAPLGSFSVLAGGAIDIAGTVSAAGGSVSLTTDRVKFLGSSSNSAIVGALFDDKNIPTVAGTQIAANVYVEGVIDVSGRFVNDSGRAPADIAGPAAINGGNITIATNTSSNSGQNDWTGSIILAKGSLLDVSSGGYISPQGKPKTVATGVMAGKGGSISLSLYQAYSFAPYQPNQSQTTTTSPQMGPAAVIELDGRLRGYGFQSNGSLTLSGVDNLQIGGSLPLNVQIGGSLPTGGSLPQGTPTSNLLIAGSPAPLPLSLLTDGGFGSYTIESVSDGHGLVSGGNTTAGPANVTVAAGASLTLVQQNLTSTADYTQVATGTKLGQQDAPALALLPDDQRQPVNLSLKADNILLDIGSVIHTDPAAKVTLGNVNFIDSQTFVSTGQQAHSVKLRGTIIDHSGSVFINAISTQLESQALVDLSGTFVASSTFNLVQGRSLTSGTYLPGGTFTVEAGRYVQNSNGVYAYNQPDGSSSLVTPSGAQVDVSGAAGWMEVAGPRGTTSSVWSWSDAGTVTADVAGFAWGGSFAAAGGRYAGADGHTAADPRANNGTIILGGGSINLFQSAAQAFSRYQQDSQSGNPNVLDVAADQLALFDNVYLYAGGGPGGASRIFTDFNGTNIYGLDAPKFGTLGIQSSINLNVANRLHIAAGSIFVDPTSAYDVRLSAPYVELTGATYVELNTSNGSVATTSGKSNLSVDAQTIDLEGARFQNFSQVNLISSGDIRLGTLKVADGGKDSSAAGNSTDAQVFTGDLTSDGNLLFSAQRIYAISAVGTFAPATSNSSETISPTQLQYTFTTATPLGLAPNTPVLVRSISDPNTYVRGTVVSDGGTNLVVTALAFQGSGTHSDWQIEPVSAGFMIQSPGTVQFRAPAGASTAIPLSAGGGLTVIANTIDQGGNLFAPLGQIKLGNTDPTVSSITTQSVTLEPGSLTSVTLADTTVPYGATSESGGWYYNASLNPMTSLPAKGVVLAGANLNVAHGSTIDLRGGGDLQGSEWIPGIGGTVDTLQTTANGPTVYALVPSINAPVAAYDIHFATSRNGDNGTIAGDINPMVGTQITIAGGGGIAAGTYTLYPAHYATLPGAMRVTLFKASNLGLNIPSGTKLTDGTVLVTGNYTQSTAPGKQSAGSAVFAVQTNPVWRSYSEYQFTSANTYFRTLAAKSGTIIPLPIDGGSLQALVTQALNLNGAFLARPGQDASGNIGSAGTLDIASTQKIDIVGDAQYVSGNVSPGDVALDVSQLDNAGFESILIGGTRSISGSATLITPASTGILVDTRGQALTAPEILLVATSATGGTGNVTVASGSVIKTTGTLHQASGRTYRFSSQSLTGALLVATNDATLNAAGPAGAGGGLVTINQGASITARALTLQATNATQAIVFDPGSLHVGQLNLVAHTVGIGAPSGTSTESLDLYNFEFGDVGGLSARALDGAIAIYGDFNPGSSVAGLTLDAPALMNANGSPNISANISVDAGGTITLLNSGAASNLASPPSAVQGSALDFSAAQIVLGGAGLTSAQAILGYGSVNLTAGERVVMAGPGGLTLGNKSNAGSFSDSVDLTIKSPLVLVAGATGAGGGSFTISTGGNVAILDTVPQSGWGAQPADSADVGGSLSVKAASINVGTVVQAQAGTIMLEATAGDVTLLPRADLDAAGYAQTLLDVTSYISGGKVVLTSDTGNVNVGAFSIVNVAQPRDGAGNIGLGYGGEVDVIAQNGNATVAGMLMGSGGPGHGGTFKIDIHGAVDLGHYVDGSENILYGLVPGLTESYQPGLADVLLFGGFTGRIDIHTRTGNIVLAQGRTLKANSITLTADDPTWDPTATWSPSNPNLLGQVQIYGTIDASGYGGTTGDGAGEAGGQVALYGANAVLLASTGVIDASTTHSDQVGGNVIVGIGWSDAGVTNSNIYLQQGTTINVAGGTRGGLSGGTVTFVAPRDGNNDVKIIGLYQGRNDRITDGQGKSALVDTSGVAAINVSGARSVIFDPYVSFDTTSSKHGIDASGLGWAAIVDAAGLYNNDGTPATAGTWTNVAGWVYSGFSLSPAQSAGLDSLSFSQINLSNPNNTTPVPFKTSFFISNAGGATANVQYGVSSFTADSTIQTGIISGHNIPVSFAQPAGGTAAQGYATTNANGQVTSITITTAGSGYTLPPTTATLTDNHGNMYTVIAAVTQKNIIGRPNIPASYLTVVGVTFDNVKSSVSGTPSVSLFGSTGSLGTIAFTQGFGSGVYSCTGQCAPGNISFNNPTVLPLQSSVFQTFDPTKENTPGYPTFTGGTLKPDGTFTFASGTSGYFIQTVLEQVTNGTWSYNNNSYGFNNLFTRLQPFVDQLGAGVVHVQPGVQLVNSSAQVNNGNITVADNWNLASGTLYDKSTNTIATTYDSANASNYYVAFNYRLATPWGSVDAGKLSLRALNDIDIGASISDGFFQFANYLDPNYLTNVQNYISSNSKSSSSDAYLYYFSNNYKYYLNGVAGPLAPYNNSANGVSPSSQDLATMDLFPYALNVCTSNCGTSSSQLASLAAPPSSWSYVFTAGADLGSANPSARASTGDVNLNNHGSYTQPVLSPPGSSGSNSWTLTPVTVNLPTMVRTGTGNITVAAAGNVVMQDTTAPGVIYAAGVNAKPLPGPTNQDGSSNPDGFLQQQVLAYDSQGVLNGTSYYGPPTAAAFSVMGGNVIVDAQGDIIGYSGSGNKVPQYYQPWLLADADLTPAQSLAAGSSVPLSGAGVFAPAGSQVASQTAWWIQYSSFQEGILSGGGNVAVVAGRDLVDVSVSLPTTGRVSGGLSATSTPVTHLYGSGNMLVRAGGNIQGGAFYEGSGDASIVARGSIGQSGTVSKFATSTLQLPDLPLLAVDTGRIEMSAGGSLSVAGVVNPAALQAQSPSYANPLESTILSQNLHFDTYGPDSGVRLVAGRGDLTIAIAPTAFKQVYSGGNFIDAAPATYPASLQALALNGNLITTGIQAQSQTAQIETPGIVLSPSDNGLFELVARDSVDLTFGFPANTFWLPYSPRPYISAGSALLQTGFDPFQPNSGFDGASAGVLLAHADDAAKGIDATARIYAATGSIIATGTNGPSISTILTQNNGYQIIQINRPAEIYAGTDITDLNVIIQNIHPNDVSTITAGRNISYTGYNNGGGVQVAGPGALFVQAGGDIGPFLPAFADNVVVSVTDPKTSLSHNEPMVQVQQGIASVGNEGTPIGDLYSSQYKSPYSVGIYDPTLYGVLGSPRRNTQLISAAGTSQGADLFVLFGIQSQPDYQAMVDRYINPAAAGSYQGYALTINGVQTDPQTGWTMFQQASAAEQHKLIYEVFFDVIKSVAKQAPTATTCPQVCQPAWDVINTLFPTGHAVGSGGELNLLHGTIQTRLGGSISLLGPGGSIVVGGLANEPNPDLRLRDLGILSLGGGGINTYTDGNVLVNSSRILTTQGGDILMWSSYGDLDAGRGSKTIVSAPTIEVNFDQNDYGTTDPGGYVTGSGIGTLQASASVPPGNLYLVAPNGTIDFGTAGVRASGKLVVVAPVLVNQSNATFTTSNIVPTVNVAGLTSGSNTAGAAAKSAEPATAEGPSQRDQASVFIVEVIGYGGGDSGAQPAPQQNGDQKQGSDDGSESTRRKQTP